MTRFIVLQYFKYKSVKGTDGQEYEGDKDNLDALAGHLAHLVAVDAAANKPMRWPDFTLR